MTKTENKTFNLGPVQKRFYNSDAKSTYMEINFLMDDIKVNIVRNEYTFEMWFAAIGGLESMYRRIFGIMVWGVTYKSFINAVLGTLFYMKKNRDKKNDFDPNDPNNDSPDEQDKKGNKKDFGDFVTEKEKEHYLDLKAELKDGKTISQTSISAIIWHMM